MPNLYPLTIQFIAALAIFLVWLREGRRPYLLWWSVAIAMYPLMAVAANQIQFNGRSDIQLPMTIYALASSGLVIGFIQGTLSYRGTCVPIQHIALAVLVLAGALLIPVGLEQIAVTRHSLIGLLFLGNAAVAVLLWPLGNFERVTSLYFGGLGLAVLVINIFHGSTTTLAYTEIMLAIASIVSLVTVLLLLNLSFHRWQQDREAHFQFLSTSNEITAQLQGVLDENEVGRRALDVILKQHFWDLGAFMLIDDSGDYLDIRITRGASPNQVELAKYKKMPLDAGLSGYAFRTRETAYAFDVSKDPRISPALREATIVDGTACQACVPITSNDQMLGILFLRGTKVRHLLPNELRTLESVGKMLGVHLDNIRNMEALSFRATHDSLTGLGNRESLHAYFAGPGAAAPCMLTLFDLDHFKDVNDSLGHSTGDRLLQALAKRLQAFVAQNDGDIFRLGGDEFVIVSRKPNSEDDCMQLALELSRLIGNPIQIGDLMLRASASIGIARYPFDSHDSHELLRCVDAAMYHAKRNEIPIAFYDTSIDAIVRERTLLINGIADALERDELELFYQPIIDLKSGNCAGCEALLRWRHPKHGLLPAGDFMPFVEKTDSIGRITHTVIDQAVLQLDAWARQGIRLKMSINFSARNIVDNEVVGHLMKLTEAHRVDPNAIQIEITETTLMKDPAAATTALRHLRDAGFSIALDDYGTGYSSLAYLANFPIDVLKIDKSFVQRVESEPRAQAIIEATIGLAHKLNLRVTAEGIETVDERNLLEVYACDLGQGYLFGKPMPAAQFSDWLFAAQGPVKNLA